MKRVSLLGLLALFFTANARTQEFAGALPQTSAKPDSLAHRFTPNPEADLFSEWRAPDLTWKSLALSAVPTSLASTASPEPPPVPELGGVYGARDDYRWQLALGIAVVRFRSSRFYATGAGTSTSLAYFTNEWLAAEGNLNTAFGANNFKYLSYGFGPRLAWRHRRIEPWMHALVGGVHVLPQTADASKSAFATQIGGGIDYRFYPHLSARVELDWVKSHLFAEWQDSVQAAAHLVLHF